LSTNLTHGWALDVNVSPTGRIQLTLSRVPVRRLRTPFEGTAPFAIREPQALQNQPNRRLPLSAFHSTRAGTPAEKRIPSSGTPAAVVNAPPLIFWQLLQWQL